MCHFLILWDTVTDPASKEGTYFVVKCQHIAGLTDWTCIGYKIVIWLYGIFSREHKVQLCSDTQYCATEDDFSKVYEQTKVYLFRNMKKKRYKKLQESIILKALVLSRKWMVKTWAQSWVSLSSEINVLSFRRTSLFHTVLENLLLFYKIKFVFQKGMESHKTPLVWTHTRSLSMSMSTFFK